MMKRFFCLAVLLLTLPSCQVVSGLTKGFQDGYNKGLNESKAKSGETKPAEIQTTEPQSSTTKSGVSKEVLERTAAALNKSTPMKVDEATVLTKVGVEQDGLLYTYELVNYDSTQLKPETAEELFRPLVKERLCADSATKADLKKGYSFYYAYFGKDKQPITKFAITPKDCGF